jgi:tetratricopeptide (TPR) repeat protein
MFFKEKSLIIGVTCIATLSGCMGPTKQDYLDKQAQLEEHLQALGPETSNINEYFTTLVELGDISASLDDYVSGKKAYMRAIQVLKKSPQDNTAKQKRARLIRDLADLYFVSHDENKALEYYTESLHLYRELEGANSNSFEVCLALLNIGNSHLALGNKEKAETFFAEFKQRKECLEKAL